MLRRSFLFPSIFALTLAAGMAPLWVGHRLPMVDLPQHLHLISVLGHLRDPSTLYPDVFVARDHLTPYLAYYEAVRALAVVFPIDLANKIFLSLYVAAIPLSVAFLLRSLKRPIWPALLSIPFAYGDSFAWGFVNSCASWPTALFGVGCALRTLAEPRCRRWPWLLAASGVVTLLFHVTGFVFLVAATLLLIAVAPRPARASRAIPTASAPAKRIRTCWATWRGELSALLGIAPGCFLFAIWMGGRVGAPVEIAPGEPWKAWGPIFSDENLSIKSFPQNLDELTSTLANMLRDGSDRWPLWAALGVAILAIAVRVADRRADLGPRPSWRARAVPPLLVGLALLLFFTLPFDVRGYVYYLNTRYAQLAAILATSLLPRIRPRLIPFFSAASAAVAIFLGVILGLGFADFDREASAFDALTAQTPERPRIMGLIFNPGARAMTHPVFIHAATELARARGGFSNFSFATTPHSPVGWRVGPPPTFPSEWRPDTMDYSTQGRAYDLFLIRGVSPERAFHGQIPNDLEITDQAGSFWIARRKRF